MASYDANIRIGVTGQNQIDAAVNSINRLQKLIDQVSRGVVLTGADPRRLSAGWDGVANSISKANRELQQFAQTANRLTQTPQRALPPPQRGLPASARTVDVRATPVSAAPTPGGATLPSIKKLPSIADAFEAINNQLLESDRKIFRTIDRTINVAKRAVAELEADALPLAGGKTTTRAAQGIRGAAPLDRFQGLSGRIENLTKDLDTRSIRRNLGDSFADEYASVPARDLRRSGQRMAARIAAADKAEAEIPKNAQRIAKALDQAADRLEPAAAGIGSGTGGRGGRGGGRRGGPPPPPPPLEPPFGPPFPNGDRRAEIALGRQRFEAEQRTRTEAGRRRLNTIGSAAIGGGFPLLFGQGAGAGLGGAVGGLLGGALGGSGGFAGGIIGSLIGTQFDKLKASALGLADALKAPSEALAAMEASGIKVSSGLKNTVDALEGLGRAAEAQALVFAELEKLGGASYVQNLLELEEANKALQEEWSRLSVAIQKELLPAFILLTNGIAGLVKFINDNKGAFEFLAILGKSAVAATGLGAIPVLIGEAGKANAENQPGNRQPQPVDDTRQRKALDEAVARQKEAEDLRRRGVQLELSQIDARFDREEAIFNFRKRAADLEKEAADFRRSIEDRIFKQRQDIRRSEADNTRQRAQLAIDRTDLALQRAGQLPASAGGGESPFVAAARDYIRIRAEGEADLQQKQVETAIRIEELKREGNDFERETAKKVYEFQQKAEQFARDVTKYEWETEKKIYAMQIEAADYQYAMWENAYKRQVEITNLQREAAANPLGDVSGAAGLASNNWQGVMEAAARAGAKFPELVAAQWAEESAWGKSQSGKNNFFGQKGPGTTRTTQEEVNGRRVTIKDQFMDFPSLDASVKYLVDKWYKGPGGANQGANAKQAAELLKRGGYATNSGYVDNLMKIIAEQRKAGNINPVRLGVGGGTVGNIYGLVNPVPSVDLRRNRGGYAGDTGLDILAPEGAAVVSMARGRLIYAEPGHSAQMGQSSSSRGYTPQQSILIELEKPFMAFGKKIAYAWYTHLQEIDAKIKNKTGMMIEQGQFLGKVGIANKVPHLHTGLLGDRQQTSYLTFDQARQVLSGAPSVGGAVPGATGGMAPVRPTAPIPLPARRAGGAGPAFLPQMPGAVNVDNLISQSQRLNEQQQQVLQTELEIARAKKEQNDLAAKANLDNATAAALQQYIQPIIDQNDALKDRAAYQREYGELLQRGILPAEAEATAQLNSQVQIQQGKLDNQIAVLKIAQDTLLTEALATTNAEERAKKFERLVELAGQLNDVIGGKDTINQLGQQGRALIEQDNSPEARRQRTLNEYNRRKNEREDPNRSFDQYMKAKADLEDLINPLNQVMSATDALGNAFGDAFQSIISGSESADEALKKMFANIGSYFLNMAAQILAQQALTSILGLLSGGLGAAAGGGSGFLTGGLFNTQLSYAGGGYTGDGARSGGVDGQGGFPAILHPQETVIDHTMAAPLRPSGEYGVSETATPEINYSGAVLRFNEQDYVAKGDVPKIINASVAATGAKMRGSVSYRKRAGI